MQKISIKISTLVALFFLFTFISPSLVYTAQASPGNGCVDIQRSLAKGDTGADVTALQLFLNTKDQAGLVADGNFGNLTMEAVSAFQTLNDIQATGVVETVTADLIRTQSGCVASSDSTSTSTSTSTGNPPPPGGGTNPPASGPTGGFNQSASGILDLKAGSGPSSKTNVPGATTTGDGTQANPFVINDGSTFYLIWTSSKDLSSCQFAPPFDGIAFPQYQNYIPSQSKAQYVPGQYPSYQYFIPGYQNYVEYGSGDMHYPSRTGTAYTMTCKTTDGTNTMVSDSVFAIDKTPLPVQGIDLTAGAPTPESNAVVAGISVRFDSLVTNFATVGITGPFSSQFQISSSASGANATSLAQVSSSWWMNLFPAGGSGTVVSPFYTFTSVGTYYVQACVDSGNVIAEADETNNCSAWTPVTVLATPPPAPVITSVSPASAAPGSTTPIIVTGMNFGTKTATDYVRLSLNGVIKNEIEVYGQSDTSLQFSLLGTQFIDLPGVYTLSVSNSTNQTISNSVPFTVTGSGVSTNNANNTNNTNTTSNTSTPNPNQNTNNNLTCTNLSSVIAEGSTGADVISLQNFLIAQGFLTGTADGIFGPKTAAAVSAFQSANGISAVGSVGPITRAKISAISCGGNTSNSGTTTITPPCPTGMVQSGNSCVVYSTNSTQASGTQSFSIGDWVVTNSSHVDAHSNASSSSPVLATYPINTGGTVLAGPTTANGLTWWEIGYAGGVSGWSVGSSLTKNSSASSSANQNTSSTSLTVGDTVSANVLLNVRQSASINAEIVTKVPSGTTGQIVGGPISDFGYTWWQINFTGGISGWSVGNYLTKVASGNNTASSGAVNNTGTNTLQVITGISPSPVPAGPSGQVVRQTIQITGAYFKGSPQIVNGQTWGGMNFKAVFLDDQLSADAINLQKIGLATLDNVSADGKSATASVNFGGYVGRWAAYIVDPRTYNVSAPFYFQTTQGSGGSVSTNTASNTSLPAIISISPSSPSATLGLQTIHIVSSGLKTGMNALFATTVNVPGGSIGQQTSVGVAVGSFLTAGGALINVSADGTQADVQVDFRGFLGSQGVVPNVQPVPGPWNVQIIDPLNLSGLAKICPQNSCSTESPLFYFTVAGPAITLK